MTHAQITAAAMSTAAINDLPDSAFAFIEPGGSKDEHGRTVPRSLRHFPIHDEAHVRNALARAPQSPFGDKAMPKIRAACKRFGIKWSGMGDKVYAAAELRDIELARPGQWNLRWGPLDVTDQMLADAARFANRDGARPGYLKIGHTDTRFMASDGEPALGWLHNIRLEEDDQGHVLKGDLRDLPDWLAEAIPRHWPDRSIEGYANYVHDGQTYGLVVDGLALLGVTPPGMPSIRSLRDLPAALGIAASGPLEPSGTRIVASFGATQDPAPEAEPHQPHEKKEGAGMDPAMIREAFGLSADASDDEVKAAIVAAGLAPPPQPQPVAAAAPGTMVVDASAWQQREDRIANLEATDARRRREERDEVIAKAVHAGKFAPARREHWVRLWDADPEGTRVVIDGLTPGLIPVAASGYAGEGADLDGIDDEFKHLFPPAYDDSSKGA